MTRPDSLVLRLHPDDPTLLEVLLREGEQERRVARAPVGDPRAWEWTTPPSWLRAGTVEDLINDLEATLQRLSEQASRSVGAPVRVVLADCNPRNTMLAEVPCCAPVGSLATVARQQREALAVLGARTGEFVQVAG